MRYTSLPYGREIKAAIAAAPKTPDQGYSLYGHSGHETERPNMIYVGTPGQLEELLQSYSLITSGSLLPRWVLEEKIGHEMQHREAAEALGATALEHGLFIPARPSFSWRHMHRTHHYQLSTIPEGLDDEREMVVTAYPTVLSPGDRHELECRNLTIEAVDDIASSHGWPRPLSLQEPFENL
jgi:hypothetical protein